MGILNWIKQRFPAYLGSTVRMSDDLQRGKPREFNPFVAVSNFSSLVYAATEMNANAVASVPLRLYARKRPGLKANFKTRAVGARCKAYLSGRMAQKPSHGVLKKTMQYGDDFEEVLDHPAIDVLRGVNTWYNGFDMTKLRMYYLILTGNSYVYVRNGNVGGRSFPVELWPMPAQWTKVIPSKEPNEPLIKGYVYGQTAAEEKTFELEDVIRWALPNPRNLYYGLGKVEAAWREVCLYNSRLNHKQAIYDNGARPDYAVIIKGANSDAITRFQKEVEQRLRGTSNHGKLLAIGGDASIVPMTFNDDQLGNDDRVIEAICHVFGVPVAKLMMNESVAGGQAGASERAYQADTVLPLCRMDEETLNASYLPRFDAEDLVLAYDNPVPADRAQETVEMTAQLGQGAISRNEWRIEQGYDPVDGGDELLVPGGLVKISKAGDPAPAPALGGFGDKRPEAKAIRDADERLHYLRLIEGIKHGIGTTFTQEQLGDNYLSVMRKYIKQSAHNRAHIKVDEETRPGEEQKPIDKMIDGLSDIFSEQKREILAAMVENINDDPISRLRRIADILDSYDDAVADALRPWLHDQLIAGGLDGMKRIGEDIIVAEDSVFNVTNPKVSEFLEDYTIRLAGNVNETTTRAIGDTLAQGVSAGDSPAMLAERVQGVFDDADGYRASMIARTESGRAYVAGAVESWKDSEVVSGKRWELSAGACDVCRAVSRYTYGKDVGLTEPFVTLGTVLPLDDGGVFVVDYQDIYGGDAHPHCRCGVQPILIEPEESK